MTPWVWFKRWRTSRGYGVHSPLGFRLVKNVVRPPRDVAYYGEERLDFFEGQVKDGGQRRRARLLLRFVAEMQPSYIWASHGLPDIYREAIGLAGSAVRIFDGKAYPDRLKEADMIVADGRKATLGRRFSLKPGQSLIGLDLKPSVVSSIVKGMKGGVVLEYGDSLIAVATNDEALHKYSVLF